MPLLPNTLAALLVAAACAPGGSPAHETPAATEVRAALVLIDGLDEEGGTIGRTRLSDTALVAFFRTHVAFGEARILEEHLAPGARVDVVAGMLTLDGTDTRIPVEARDGVSFVPVQPLADRFRAYARIEESPGRMVTLWRHDILCRYARDADRRAEVFLAAAEQGLLRQCNPPIDAEVRRWSNAMPNERWAASLTLRPPLDVANAAALLEQYRVVPSAAYGVVAGHHLLVRASLTRLLWIRLAGLA